MARHESAVIYITAFVISAMLFAAGVATGIFILEWRNHGIEEKIGELALSAEDVAIQLQMLGDEGKCDSFSSFSSIIIDQLGKIEESIGEIERSNDINKLQLDFLRKKYHLLSLRYYLALEKFRGCYGNKTTILYFYDDGKKCRLCEKEGIILTHIKKKYGDKVLIFSFDHSIGLSSIILLERTLGISSYPSVVINGKVHGYMGLEEIEKEIKGG